MMNCAGTYTHRCCFVTALAVPLLPPAESLKYIDSLSRPGKFSMKIAPSFVGIWTPIQFMVSSAHPCPLPKRYFDQFSHFCAASGGLA